MATSRVGLAALAVGGGALALGAIAAIFAVVRAFAGGTPAPPPAQPDRRGAEVATEGMRAPGTAELRRLGCETALVVDLSKLLSGASAVREGEPRYVVTCDVSADAGAPTCERVASTYFTAIGGTTDSNVNVRVSPRGSAHPTCSRLYAGTGADLGPFPRTK